jgi:hypothetical protein
MAAPELLLVLLSLLSAKDSAVEVDVVVVVAMAVLLLSVVVVLTLLSVCVVTLLSVTARLLRSVAMLLVLVLPSVVSKLLLTCANDALLNPNAMAMAETISVFFMEPPEVGEVE